MIRGGAEASEMVLEGDVIVEDLGRSRRHVKERSRENCFVTVERNSREPVSYTHLTLPTIYSV